jgi:pimeloyl-ACP methyl ester carboxylesterase
MMDISQRRIATNGIELNIAELLPGQKQPNDKKDNPLVLMVHGFPESWYSWRHQFAPLANAGFHAVAPDMRGYGKSDKPDEISAYNQVEVVNDIIGLIPALGYESAIVIGHDWGAPTAWSCALHHPDKVTAVGALSVPFSPRSEVSPMQTMRAMFKDMFFYQMYFQEPGVAEAELEADIEVSLRKFFHLASGDNEATSFEPRPVDSDLLSDSVDPGKLGPWCSEEDLKFYVGEFSRSGFRGPLNYYRNFDLTWNLTDGAPKTISQPAMFVAGEKDGVIVMAGEALKLMPERVPDLRINELIPGVGHWTQQEAPDAVNDAILRFLKVVS